MLAFLRTKRIQHLFAAGLIAGVALFALLILAPRLWSFVRCQLSDVSCQVSSAPKFGVTFSVKYARELGLDWKEAFTATLDDLKVRRFRIPVYWDDVERSPGVRDWSDIDWMLAEAEKRGAEVILAVGRKVPRWPECHVPGWVKGQGSKGKSEEDALMEFLAAEISHFKDSPVITTWQVENEPLFQFGRCPPPDRAFLKREVELVKSLDARPVMLTDSGELSTWIRTGTLADILGISMYRLVWNKYLGELYWPVSPLYYTERINLLSPVVKTVIISELQAEPWFKDPPRETPFEEQFDQMDRRRFLENVAFARGTGVPDILLWGVEWWYWARQEGHPEMWEAARPLF